MFSVVSRIHNVAVGTIADVRRVLESGSDAVIGNTVRVRQRLEIRLPAADIFEQSKDLVSLVDAVRVLGNRVINLGGFADGSVFG